MGIAAGEVAARGADIGHKHGVADKDRITDVIFHIGWRMSRHIIKPLPLICRY